MKCSLFLVFLLIHLCTLLFGDSQAEGQKRCNIAYKCSTIPKPVWTTTNGLSCEVFRNQCYLNNENCQRVNRDEPEAREIDEDKCRDLCKSAPPCPTEDHPVCGYYEDERKTFPSECDMKKYVCETAKTFDLLAVGKCKG
ncbi:U-Kazal-Dg21.2-like [Eupeodes corollae]|uniref:U-Kazal-Dg21.2-like n=1 Tax=Eupeodes corollae TaxID=290404 RepID=UPI002492154C|nr:U-Kazal-Dg21.2-like [Eupeodes corollae]